MTDSSGTGGNTASAWGGFLKKAMEGVEQQLDRVLENPPPKAREVAAAAKKEVPVVQSKPVATAGLGRMTLQERLAASIAKSRTGSPKAVSDEITVPARSSGDLSRVEFNGALKTNGPSSPVRSETPQLPSSPVRKDIPAVPEVKDLPSRTETPDIPMIQPEELVSQSTPIEQSKGVSDSVALLDSIEAPPRTSSARLSSASLPTDTDPATVELISQLRADLEVCETRRIEESQQASERIASLEQKLKILQDITNERSKEIAADSSADALEKKLADREEKIVLLLDEGEKLAKVELNLMTTIKSLRTKQKEDTSLLTTAQSRADKSEKQLADLKLQLKKANEIEKKNTERLKAMYKIEAANEAMKRERDAAQATIVTLQNALAEAVVRAEEAVNEKQTEALEQERRANAELREMLEGARSESTLLEDRLTNEIVELKGRLEKEQAAARNTKEEMTAEINTLESKLEVLRSRVEESSTSANSSAQAKMMRQIEMLQTQHTIASQNWQRIEGSLQHRAESLEKEKLDWTRKWEDEKKNVKEAMDAKRAVQGQLDDLKQEVRRLEDDLLKAQSQLQSSQERIHSLESLITSQKETFTKEKQSLQESFEVQLDNRLREEKQKWEEDQQQQLLFTTPSFSTTPLPHLTPSPLSPRPQNRGFKSGSPQPDPLNKSRIPSRTTSYGELPHLRRPSRIFSPTSFDSPVQHIPTLEDEEEREFLSPSRGDSPKNTVVDAVSVSASTGTAGPSVNIMERMSAAVRRLESDLAATKEEMGRVVRQRDEAREECVKLMGEVEEKRRFELALRELQSKFDELENRYNEALVLLGEKSERVEELQMDIVDLKEGYQHALQRLVGGR